MFGERIGEYLTENQIDRSLLAQQIGVSAAELEGMLSGARVLPAEVYFFICRALHLDVEYFSGRAGHTSGLEQK